MVVFLSTRSMGSNSQSRSMLGPGDPLHFPPLPDFALFQCLGSKYGELFSLLVTILTFSYKSLHFHSCQILPTFHLPIRFNPYQQGLTPHNHFQIKLNNKFPVRHRPNFCRNCSHCIKSHVQVTSELGHCASGDSQKDVQ